jgi:hypothetical protein
MVGVIVVHHRTPELGIRCIESLSSASSIEDLVVVDTSGGKNEMTISARAKVVKMEDNRGFGAAVNQGVEAVKGDYLLITNADVYFEPGAVDCLADALNNNPDWALAAPLLRELTGNVQESSFKFPGFRQALIDLLPVPRWLRHSRFNGRYPPVWGTTRSFQIDYPLGACLMIRRGAFDSIHGFDESYFLYSEEIDLCRRLHKHGWGVGHVAAASAVHVGGASTLQDRNEMLEHLYTSRAKYFSAHHSYAYAMAVRLTLAVGLTLSPLWKRLPRYEGLSLGVGRAIKLAWLVMRV